jgi:predicted DNA-binding transcriptional regulator YafY
VDLVALDEEEMKNEEKFSTARIQVRKGKGANLRSGAKVSEIDSEWDELEVQFLTPEHIIREVLWVGENAIIVEPQELRETLISHLREVAANHG